MVAAVHDVLEALSSMGITIEAHGDSLRYHPAAALTPELRLAVKSCKAGLLEMLKSPKDLGVVAAPLSLTAPGTQVHPIGTLTHPPADGDSYADLEWARFEQIAKPLPDGGGWFDPAFGPDLPRGITGEQWDQFIADFAHLGRAVKS